MMMPGRKYAAENGYRYGFNGKENDNDVKGEGNQQDYGMRIYDTRVGRFLSVDPITTDYPWYTPYQFAGNKPIWATDIDGLEENTTSTYVKPPFIELSRPTFKGVITITDARNQEVHKLFQGNYLSLKKADKLGLGPAIVNQIAGENTENGLSLDIQFTGVWRQQINKSIKSTDILQFYQYGYTINYLNEDDDVVTESGSFEVNYNTIKGTSLYEIGAGIILNKVVSFALTRVVNGTSLIRGADLTGDAAIKSNAQVSKLLRWANVSNRDYNAAAKTTSDFTKKLGNKAIDELKKLGYTKEDFTKWKKTYSDAVKNLSERGKNTAVQQARLESVEKILSLWK